MNVLVRSTALLLLLLLASAPLAAKDGGKKKTPETKFLEGIGKLLEKGDAAGIAEYFPEKGKVELSLKGIKNGKYRNEQAKSLLSTYFKRNESASYELKEAKSTVGKFEMKYKVKADGTEVKGHTWVYFKKEGDSWTITGIAES